MLFYLAMEEHDLFRDGGRGITNIGVCMILSPLGILTPREHQEAIDRLMARGFVHLAAPGEYFTDPLVARVQHRRELPAQFLMQWNAAKAQWPPPQDSPEPYDGSAPRPRRPKPVAVGSGQLTLDDLADSPA
ncbi:hypothetical protein FNV62_07605 [Streptomyces sp. RLB3-17]|uniref:hypothetical protein n=1 Tax=unclassified Streptomyces TaxID=2593676 RepID=UPI0011648117|nr:MULTISPECIES: hypothetical protein [unclassified Streptomyces]NMI56030.1 hypothetical protein [Streptomyces sp. RLA2-12]QDN55483.1 hypothetical protein FNV67_09365 [Streptomyces sp. S1D4-20]QDN65661.1 hypothetical protein FNV66_08960 [Streptomyces sp. S1D4-14]QDN96304.1 hypothetical protein FNV58_10110 [Streptomyces sp. RLB1-9]QDO18013.1 hypothetical protein FNV65_08560 [Streptomyces sp. S1A1-8]